LAEHQTGDTREQSDTTWKRRGLFAAAWAALAAIVARQTTEPVSATTTDTNFVANGTATIGVDASPGTFSIGVDGRGSTAGVNATGGTFGVSASGTNTGMYGVGPFGGASLGQIAGFQAEVDGTNPYASALYAFSVSSGIGSMGVRGTIHNSVAAASTIGVYGENLSSNTGGLPGAGGFGVYGYSAKGHGVAAAAGTAGAGAIVGATNGIAGAYAGIFFGALVVVGGPKSAAVANEDGSHSLLYCLESPESWFEDFGKAELSCGRAEVDIDPAFAAVADVSEYHVFLTARGRYHLAVTRQTPAGFTVEASAVAAADDTAEGLEGTFSWRLVAKRKDIPAPRLAKIQLPPEPKRPDLPAPRLAARPQPFSRVPR
jgi:hypothetical protein